MIAAAARTLFEARVESFPAGITGEVGVRILDNAGNIVRARHTTGIIEDPAGSGSYVVTLTAPNLAGAYSVFWDWGDGVTLVPSHTAAEDLIVGEGAPVGAAPLAAQPDVIVPHFSLPFRIVGDAVAVSEQGSTEEIADSVRTVLSYPRESRLELPEFGLPDQTFLQGGVSAQDVQATIARWEPRAADAKITAGRDGIDVAIDQLTITVHAEGAA